MGNHFQNVGGLKPRRSVFDLSYRKNFTCNMGELIPVMCDEVVPGDSWTIGNELIVRFQPLAAPVMHEINATVHYFFVPYRILWDNWEKFISQGQLSGEHPLAITLPYFDYPNILPHIADGQYGTLWDYFGFPIAPIQTTNPPEFTAKVLAFPWFAYNLVWNEYYRDENLQLEVDPYNNRVLHRNWKKDYFTSALPFRQKGQAPGMPITLDYEYNQSYPPIPTAMPVVFGPRPSTPSETTGSYGLNVRPTAWFPDYSGVLPAGQTVYGGNNAATNFSNVSSTPNLPGNATNALPMVTVLLRENYQAIGDTIAQGLNTGSSSFNIADMRLAFQTQKWLERNARGGTRYTEFLRSHFGVAPSDSRLDRPEYIGGTKMPVRISEVLQTSESTNSSPQANMGGHGLAADGNIVGRYHVQEFGLIIGLMSVMPKRAYQNGINRQWTRRLPTDFYFPEFANLSEQGIFQYEIAAGMGNNDDYTLFGYCGQYDEMRVKHDIVCKDMRVGGGGRPTLDYWNLADSFNYAIPPRLNTEFITCVPRRDIFLVGGTPSDPVDTLIVNCNNLIRAVRPMPEIAEPGLIDHH